MSAALQELIGKIRAVALVRGEAWLREKVAEIIAEEGSQDPPPCAKRGRALERRSPSPVPRNRRKLSSKDPPEVSGGPCPASEASCSAKNQFSLDSNLQDGGKGLWIPVTAASQRRSDSGPSSEGAGIVPAENQKSNDDGGQKHSSLSPNQPMVKAETCNNTSNGKLPDTNHSSNTEEESIESRIESLLERCSAAIELQQEEDEPPESTPAPASSSAPDLHPCLVWILGNSFVAKALEKVSLVPDGRQLGFPLSEATIRWLGFNDLPWRSVIPTVVRYSHSNQPPDILVIHAGWEDIYSGVCILDLIKNIKCDISRLMLLFPRVVIVWSEIMTRPRCPEGKNRNTLNRACRNVNKLLQVYLEHKWTVVAHHMVPEDDLSHLFEEDGVCLNSVGNDIWCAGIKKGINKALQRWHHIS
ncbi:uncharacterized protein ACNLHF_000922 [Anomaloglossus baeobatrachus]|uniref:uncharacterized protein LOC142250813 n=1 Tax=Anomaloglossus baeobatrachus TaxID=238106 RepID=UPI003F4FADB3